MHRRARARARARCCSRSSSFARIGTGVGVPIYTDPAVLGISGGSRASTPSLLPQHTAQRPLLPDSSHTPLVSCATCTDSFIPPCTTIGSLLLHSGPLSHFLGPTILHQIPTPSRGDSGDLRLLLLRHCIHIARHGLSRQATSARCALDPHWRARSWEGHTYRAHAQALSAARLDQFRRSVARECAQSDASW